MNSELLKKLIEISKENQAKIENLKGEYETLTDLDRELSKKDNKKLKEIRSEIARLNSLNSELNEDLKYYKGLTNNIKNFKKGLKNQTDPEKIELLTEKVERLESEYQSFGEGMKEKYETLVEDYENAKEKEQRKEDKAKEKEEKRENKKGINKTAITLALLAALGIGTTGYVIGKGSINSSSLRTSMVMEANENEKEEENPERKNVSSTNENHNLESRITYEKELKEDLKFTDINDESQVEERAYEVIKYLDKNIENHDYTVDEVANIIRWINGGKVESANFDDALFAISRVEDIMNKENQGEVKETFDVSQLFLDGSRGQKLAGKIYESKKSLMKTKGTDEFNKKAEDFAKLVINSWLLNGTNNVQSAYSLEKAGMKTMVDVYFLNTYAYINVPVNVNITVEDRTTEYNLDEVAVLLNQPSYCDENGNIDENTMDKFSSDFNDMVDSAIQVKENSNGLTLNN